jgi:hypothetical protein
MRSPNLLQNFEAADVGHHYVEKDHVESPGAEEFERLEATVGFHDIETSALEPASKNGAIVGDIIDNQKARIWTVRRLRDASVDVLGT